MCEDEIECESVSGSVSQRVRVKVKGRVEGESCGESETKVERENKSWVECIRIYDKRVHW